jgi:hypothetical protein
MKIQWRIALFVVVALFSASVAQAAPKKVHTVGLGAAKKVPYSKAGDPAGAATGEDALKIRPLLVDGVLKEWTAGESHDVTDRSFLVRRVIRLNDILPGDKQAHWVWQRGPWLLPDYDPGVSQVSWFRDYGAYCGLTATGKSLYAVVAQIAGRRPLLAKKLAAFDAAGHADPVCGAAEWQREPLRITFQPTGRESVSFDLVPGSAVLVEETGDEAETPAAEAK